MKAHRAMLRSVVLLTVLTCAGYGEIIHSDWDNPDLADPRDGWICSNPADGYLGRLTGGDPGATVTWDPSGGGCLRLDDPAVQAPDYFIAPPKFLVNDGDWLTGYSKGSVSFWYKKGLPLARVPEIWIEGNGEQWMSGTKPGWESVFGIYKDTEWHRYEIGLHEANWYPVGSASSWHDAFHNVSDVGVLADLRIGAEHNCLDEFCLELIPLTVAAAVDFDPATLNLANNGKWITAYITLPAGYDVSDVDPTTILLNEEIAPAWSMVDEEEQVLKVKFDRAAVQELLSPGEVELKVTGLLTGEILFEGSDTIIVIDPGHVDGPDLSGYDLFEYNGHLYALTLCVGTWEECEAEALMVGGHLVTINDATENDWLYYIFLEADQPFVGAVPYMWIGLYQDHADPAYYEPSGGWKWISGEPVTFMNWAFPEPTNSAPCEDYATIAGYKPYGLWNDWGPDRPDFVPAHGIIEIDAE